MIELLVIAGAHRVALFAVSTVLVLATEATAAAQGSDPAVLITLAVIGGLPATIASIGAIVIGLRNSAKVSAVATAVDGVSSKLVAATERAARAEGAIAGADAVAAAASTGTTAALGVAITVPPAVPAAVTIVQGENDPAVRVDVKKP